jgi:hypothetical protein
MAIHYEVPEGQSLLIEGPANVIVKTGVVPTIGVPPEPPVARKGKEHAEDRNQK